jgi:plasmid stabilization system protein ParE
MSARYSRRALYDIESLLAHTQSRSPSGADVLSLVIEQTVAALTNNPRAGSKVSRPNTFRWPVKRYRISVFYRLAANGDVEVLRVVRSGKVKSLQRVPR